VDFWAGFAGNWRLDRVILGADGAETGRLVGTARFVTRDGGYDYAEDGTLTLPGAPPMPATRASRWDLVEGRVVVAFPDGRPFHAFARAAAAEAVHLCDPDIYRVAYDFRDWPVWRADWRVTGPRKDYRMVSVYRR
jgi:hypothetical protein